MIPVWLPVVIIVISAILFLVLVGGPGEKRRKEDLERICRIRRDLLLRGEDAFPVEGYASDAHTYPLSKK